MKLISHVAFWVGLLGSIVTIFVFCTDISSIPQWLVRNHKGRSIKSTNLRLSVPEPQRASLFLSAIFPSTTPLQSESSHLYIPTNQASE